MTAPAPGTGIPDGVTQVVCSGSTGVTGEVWTNVFNLQGGPSDASRLLIRDRFVTFYSALAAGDVLPFNWSLTNIKIVDGEGAGAGKATEHVVNVLENSANASPLPPQLALVITWRTALAGRSYRGRTYVGPLGIYAIDTANGRANAGTVATINNAATALRTGLLTDTFPLVVYSRKLGLGTQITSNSVGSTVDTQRRRRSALRG